MHVNESGTKPRKGTFEVRLSDGTVVVSLAAMPRPFTKLRELDMEATVEQALAAYHKVAGGVGGGASGAGNGGAAAKKEEEEKEEPAPAAATADSDAPAPKKKTKAKK